MIITIVSHYYHEITINYGDIITIIEPLHNQAGYLTCRLGFPLNGSDPGLLWDPRNRRVSGNTGPGNPKDIGIHRGFIGDLLMKFIGKIGRYSKPPDSVILKQLETGIKKGRSILKNFQDLTQIPGWVTVSH